MKDPYKKYLIAKQKANDKYKKDMLKLSEWFDLTRNREMYTKERKKIEETYDKTINKLQTKYDITARGIYYYLKEINIPFWSGGKRDKN